MTLHLLMHQDKHGEWTERERVCVYTCVCVNALTSEIGDTDGRPE